MTRSRALLGLLSLGACRPEEIEVTTCPPPPLRHGESRVRRLSCADDLPGGQEIAARLGDWVLENQVSRWVVRDGPEGHGIVGLTGGNVVDAVLLGDGLPPGDPLREWVASVGFWLLAPESFAAQEGSLTVRGTLTDLPTIHEILPVPRPAAAVSWTYTVHPTLPVLELRASLDEPAGLADLMLPGAGVSPFLPGFGLGEPPVTAEAPLIGLDPAEPGSVPALVSGSALDRSLVAAGALRALLYEPAEGAVVRWLALGYDLAEATANVRAAQGSPNERWDNPHASAEMRDRSGAPLARCDRSTCEAVPGATDLVEIWRGDGNGGPGGPDQVGVPAHLRIEAGAAAFRATAVRADGEQRDLVDTDGDATFLLPPGSWEVWVTGGPTRSWHHEIVELAAGELRSIRADLAQVVDTSGWIAADLHVHTEGSIDSRLEVARRLDEAVAEGLGWVVLTEHDYARPAPQAPADLTVTVGVEVSTMRRGHFSTWPVAPDPDRAGQGAPVWHGLTDDALFTSFPGAVQCNHPRFDDGGYAASFLLPDFDRTACDRVELLNGYAEEDTASVLLDWLELLSAGHRVVATGTSDSHDTEDFCGSPRTWIRAAPGSTWIELEAALSAGRAVASAGPFLDLELSAGGSEAGVGDTLVVDAAAPIVAAVRLAAPEWMALGELDLYVDGIRAQTLEVASAPVVGGAVDLRLEIPVAPSSYVVAVHRGPRPGPAPAGAPTR
jgi:hypothetical protein